ncbi:TonB-dependent hemoglobin/transferrin/lactoferrin family receptor [Luteolibacter sp. SL250]|uniref:TonB-dependent hemoglobin/transferrin/lactoferrin family receptor n=1 Tax=Luteolibacter sp. SL250 TaxID=2995170 RepID=UPI00227177C4|nr:TonB-dependent hemoglobin/transferrin/lactoferrin family receptor [Luteolibacter sp. SL250]WAC18140.1 TonB-dependent hemoglobin/transferrin/lactoferrin family receptor [Luteolibacter sp. SL250]
MNAKTIGAFIASGLLGATFSRGEEELGEIIVVGNRIGRTWIDSAGTVLRRDYNQMLEEGTYDLAGFAKYDPTVSLPFDFASGDGAYAYGQSGYGSINIRGMEGNRITMELDGVRQPPQYVSTSFDMGSDDGAGGVGRDYFDPAMFDAVEVLKGGASALYGSDALGGVVSFTTPDPEHFLKERDYGALLRSQYYSVNESYSLLAGGAVRKGDTAFMLMGSWREGHENGNNGNIAPNPADFDSLSLLFKAEHRMDRHLFRLAVETFERDSFIDARSAAESSFVLFNDFVHNNQYLERQRVSAWWDYEPRRWLDEVKVHGYWQQSSSTSDSRSASKPIVIGGVPIPGTSITRQQSIEFDTDVLGLTTTAMKELGQGGRVVQQLLMGIDLSFEENENRFFRINNNLPSDRVSFSPTETLRAGVFVQDEFRIGDQWSFTPGVRFDWQSIKPRPSQGYLDRLNSLGNYGYAPPEDYDNLAISPRLTVSWKPRETVQWYATYAHGVRNPTAEELSMVFDHPPDGSNPAGSMTLPNSKLKEEKSDAFEIGVKTDSDVGRFQASAFHTRYDDFIENGHRTGDLTDDGRDILTTVNRGRADIYGFELGGLWNLGQWWSQAEGWQVGLSTGKSVGINRSDSTWLNTVEPWKSVASIGYDDPAGRFGARLTGVYTDEVTRVDDNTNQGDFYRPPAWFTLDLSAYWRPADTVIIHAGLNNIFDEKYWSWGSVRRGGGHLGGNSVSERSTAPGRNFSISLTKTF